MELIRIGGTRHVIETLGKTLCGDVYPRHWPTFSSSKIDCEICCRLAKSEEETALAVMRAPIGDPDAPDIPW